MNNFGIANLNQSIKGQQVLISDLSISNGGGRFSQLSTKGLFDCVDINTAPASVAPFYERFRRFYMHNVFFSTVYNIGFIQGFETVSINNCIFNGGAVFTLAPELYYTNYGITISSGLVKLITANSFCSVVHCIRQQHL